MHFVATVVTIFVLVTAICCEQEGYYWREFLGLVPPDALVVGQDKDGNDIHVGQAYIKGAGLIPSRVVSGEKYMFIPYGGLVVIGKFVKVLCGSPENFFWSKANSSSLQSVVTTPGQSPVIGGHEDVSVDYVYVGKAIVRNEVKVGKITPLPAENREDSHFYYSDEGFEGKLGKFEVLMYRNASINSVEKIKPK